jgi:hypothetical protein
VNGVLLESLAYPDPDGLVVVGVARDDLTRGLDFMSLAVIVPTTRASRVDPVEVLRLQWQTA